MGLEILDWLSTGLKCLLKRSLSRSWVVAWNGNEVCPPDMHWQVRQFFPHEYEPGGWLC